MRIHRDIIMGFSCSRCHGECKCSNQQQKDAFTKFSMELLAHDVTEKIVDPSTPPSWRIPTRVRNFYNEDLEIAGLQLQQEGGSGMCAY